SNQNLKVSLFGKNNLDVLYSGQAVFGATNRGATTVIGTTGAKAGSGTDTATANTQLLVSHTLTTFASGSGVAAGTSSAAGDTIIGASGTHKLTINDTSGNGSAGTISLNGGPPVSYDSSQTNLKVQGPNGEVVYLDTTAMTPGFNGTIDMTATG